MLLILLLNKALEEYWYWSWTPHQYQDFLILTLILTKGRGIILIWTKNPSQYQDILILILILKKGIWGILILINKVSQYQDILILILIKALSNFDLDIEEISRFQAQASFLRKLSCLHFWLQQMAFQHKPLMWGTYSSHK